MFPERSSRLRSRRQSSNPESPAKTGRPASQFLKGVPPNAIPLIRRLQPFEGCAWTRDLRELSNPDKHRHLTSVKSNLAAIVKGAEVVDVDPETGKGSLRIRYDAEIELCFADGRPMEETLETLCGEPAATVALVRSGISSR